MAQRSCFQRNCSRKFLRSFYRRDFVIIESAPWTEKYSQNFFGKHFKYLHARVKLSRFHKLQQKCFLLNCLFNIFDALNSPKVIRKIFGSLNEKEVRIWSHKGSRRLAKITFMMFLRQFFYHTRILMVFWRKFSQSITADKVKAFDFRLLTENV